MNIKYGKLTDWIIVVFLLCFLTYSCKTCNCPAYSGIPEKNIQVWSAAQSGGNRADLSHRWKGSGNVRQSCTKYEAIPL